MSKKAKAAPANDVDDLLGNADDTKTTGKATGKASGKASKATGKASGKASKATGKASKANGADSGGGRAESAIRVALGKVRKETSYADFSEANGFNIRSVRRLARQMRDAGEIELLKEGTSVFIAPAA